MSGRPPPPWAPTKGATTLIRLVAGRRSLMLSLTPITTETFPSAGEKKATTVLSLLCALISSIKALSSFGGMFSMILATNLTPLTASNLSGLSAALLLTNFFFRSKICASSFFFSSRSWTTRFSMSLNPAFRQAPTRCRRSSMSCVNFSAADAGGNCAFADNVKITDAAGLFDMRTAAKLH